MPTRNFGVYVRSHSDSPFAPRRLMVFRTHRTEPDPEWGEVTCIHPDVPSIREGEAMIHALRAVGYTEEPMR